eukprot:m.61982 g.61982  ORF g.61982 m.61982 type:complete len:341 (-) comp19322_c0_seq2:56-1078(-)
MMSSSHVCFLVFVLMVAVAAFPRPLAISGCNNLVSKWGHYADALATSDPTIKNTYHDKVTISNYTNILTDNFLFSSDLFGNITDLHGLKAALQGMDAKLMSHQFNSISVVPEEDNTKALIRWKFHTFLVVDNMENGTGVTAEGSYEAHAVLVDEEKNLWKFETVKALVVYVNTVLGGGEADFLGPGRFFSQAPALTEDQKATVEQATRNLVNKVAVAFDDIAAGKAKIEDTLDLFTNDVAFEQGALGVLKGKAAIQSVAEETISACNFLQQSMKVEVISPKRGQAVFHPLNQGFTVDNGSNPNSVTVVKTGGEWKIYKLKCTPQCSDQGYPGTHYFPNRH